MRGSQKHLISGLIMPVIAGKNHAPSLTSLRHNVVSPRKSEAISDTDQAVDEFVDVYIGNVKYPN